MNSLSIANRLLAFLCLPVLMTCLTGCQPTSETEDASAASPDVGLADAKRMSEEDVDRLLEADKVVPLDPAEEKADAEPAEPPASLGIGDPAPALSIAEWSMGEPFGKFEEDKVHVVEFWATWCGPCRTSMPHISELQQDYGEKVRFVGITREDTGTVENFLGREQSEGKTWSEVIKYRLAIDENGQTSNDYMRAAKQNGIPTAFIVGKDGIVEWIGHPMQIDQPLEQIVNDSWDRDAAIADFNAKALLAENSRKLSMLQRSGKYEEALAVLDDLAKAVGDNHPSVLMSRMNILKSLGRTEEMAEVREKVVDLFWENAMGLNQIAWETATSGEKSDEDLALAMKAAERAVELTENEDGTIMDTLARVYYEKGDLEKAIEWQEKAVEHAGGQRKQIQKTLDQYLAERESE